MLRDLWTYRRGLVLTVGAVVLVVIVAVVLAVASGRATGGDSVPPGVSDGAGSGGPASPVPSPSVGGAGAVPGGSSPAGVAGAQGGAGPVDGSDGYPAGDWDLLPDPVSASVSPSYPAIPDEARSQQDLFASAFGRTLFTRDYAGSSRGELLSWAQAMGAPLTIEQVALSDSARRKVLGQSLTMPDFDAEQTVPVVPDEATWGALAAAGAYTTVSDVSVEAVPGSVFPPPNTTFALPTFDRLVTATVSLHSGSGDSAAVTRTSVSFEVLMTLDKGQLGAAEVQHFVSAQMGG